MTKRFLLLLIGLLAFLLVACNSGTPEPEVTAPPSLTPIPTQDDTGYPGPVANTPVPDGYPAVPTAPAAPVGYPDAAANLIWIIRPLGQQCVDPATYTYPDLATAIAALTEATVAVLASEEVALNVCAACDCPTSEHFRVQIYASDLPKAEPLGWIVEN